MVDCDIKKGMTSKEVLDLPGRSMRVMVAPPATVGMDRRGEVLRFFYPDVQVTFKLRFPKGGAGDLTYRVTDVAQNAAPRRRVAMVAG